MLKNLILSNFKSWQELEIDFAPITLLYGTNSSGKSSLIQFLLMLKQTKDSTDFQVAVDFGDENKLVDLGSYQDVVYQHDANREIYWKLGWETDRTFGVQDPAQGRTGTIYSGNEIGIEVVLHAQQQRPVIEYMGYHVGERVFYIYQKDREQRYQLEVDDGSQFRFVRTVGRKWDLPSPNKAYSFPDKAQTYFQNSQFLGLLESLYADQFNALLYLGPLRDDPRRQYTWSGSYPVDVGTKGEKAVEAILAATERGEKRNLRKGKRLRPFQETIALWLQELKLIHSFEVREVSKGSGLYRAYVKRTARSPETLITDVGFGVSQVLPVIVLLYYAPEGSTILIEQPEIHLHPAVQSGLADLFISVAKARQLQLIVESHSEHLLSRLTRRIAERETEYGEITPDDVAVYFAETKGGQSAIEALNVNSAGAITNWPKDFFGDQMGEVFAREEAALLRKANS